MTVTDTLADVKFVVGADGQPTAALLDIDTWRAIVAMLEEAEDRGLLRAYLTKRRNASTPADLGLIPWEQVEAELDTLEAENDAAVDLAGGPRRNREAPRPYAPVCAPRWISPTIFSWKV
jgi:hypothetical protein